MSSGWCQKRVFLMKKQTLQKWVCQQKQTAQHEHNETLRTARMAALEQCETWLYALTWATMRSPVRQICEALRQEGLPLVQKGTGVSETEAAHLAGIRASHAIYTVFLHKITPTALQAEIEHDTKQRARGATRSISSTTRTSVRKKRQERIICSLSHTHFSHTS